MCRPLRGPVPAAASNHREAPPRPANQQKAPRRSANHREAHPYSSPARRPLLQAGLSFFFFFLAVGAGDLLSWGGCYDPELVLFASLI